MYRGTHTHACKSLHVVNGCWCHSIVRLIEMPSEEQPRSWWSTAPAKSACVAGGSGWVEMTMMMTVLIICCATSNLWSDSKLLLWLLLFRDQSVLAARVNVLHSRAALVGCPPVSGIWYDMARPYNTALVHSIRIRHPGPIDLLSRLLNGQKCSSKRSAGTRPHQQCECCG